MRNLFNTIYDFFFVDHAREVSIFWMTLAIIVLVVTQTGCANYQFGDITKRAITARNIWCTSTDAEQRQAAKARLEAVGINTGDRSVCSWTVEYFIDRVRAR